VVLEVTLQTLFGEIFGEAQSHHLSNDFLVCLVVDRVDLECFGPVFDLAGERSYNECLILPVILTGLVSKLVVNAIIKVLIIELFVFSINFAHFNSKSDHYVFILELLVAVFEHLLAV
jgi:hypothetical protein